MALTGMRALLLTLVFSLTGRSPVHHLAHDHRHRRKRHRRRFSPRHSPIATAAARPLPDLSHRTLPVPNTPRWPISTPRRKRGFLRGRQPSVAITSTSTIDVSLSHQQEVHEVVDVHESPPAIDPAQIASQETISGLDVIDIVYPGTHDYRNVLNFIPGVVQDQDGQPHVAGGQTYQTVTLLDGFNVTQPANGQLLVHVSADAFRSIQVEPSREPAEFGKGSAGSLRLNTGIGDDHFRFFATNFIPSIQNKHGWRFYQFLPRFTTSGPILKRKIWFYNAFEGTYTNQVYTALPVDQDSDYIWRIGNLSKVQTNLTSRNILTTSFLINYLHDQYAYLSPQSPQLTNPQDVETAYVGSVKDQHYFNAGHLLETGFAFSQYNLRLTPYGTAPYQITPSTAFGNFYLNEHTAATRWQGLANLYLSPRSGTVVTISRSGLTSTASTTTPSSIVNRFCFSLRV